MHTTYQRDRWLRRRATGTDTNPSFFSRAVAAATVAAASVCAARVILVELADRSVIQVRPPRRIVETPPLALWTGRILMLLVLMTLPLVISVLPLAVY